jgi:sulfite exporter TauE/SafE
MPLFLSLLPLYLMGNLHCIGMCGPLVLLIGQHRTRYYYFLGRTLSFSLAGWLAGEMGAVLHVFLQAYHLSAGISFLFAFLAFGMAMGAFWSLPGPSFRWISAWLGPINRSLSLLLLRDQPWPSFLFGFFTVALPCGQTVVVFSACALYGDPLVGLLNGCAFALLTSPSLFMAMQAKGFFQNLRRYYNVGMGCSALLIGGLALCRGCADMGWIPHLVLNAHYHIVLY